MTIGTNIQPLKALCLQK